MAGIDRGQLKHDPVAEAIVRFLGRIKQHRRQVVLYGVAAILVIIVAASYALRKESRPVDAGYALATARSAAEMEEVVAKYKDTFAASAALVQLGQLAVQETNYAKAMAYYRRVVDDYPDSFLVPGALLAVVKCHIAQGNYRNAETALKRELLYNRDNYAAAIAQLDLVRVLCAMGRYSEAWEEMQMWDQMVGNTYVASLGNGLREKLLRVTGLSTNLLQQANEGTAP